MRHFVVPDALIAQHDTAAGFPQVDLVASFCTTFSHCGGSWPFWTLVSTIAAEQRA